MLVCQIHATVETEDGPDGKTKMKIKAPVLSDEESHSSFIPDHMRCDGCKAVGFQMYVTLNKAATQRPSLKGNIPESEILDAFDNLCLDDTQKVFEAYTMKEVDGHNRLSGPGIEKESKGPTMIQGGGFWPGRLRNICLDFIDKVGEENLYSNFKKVETLEAFWQYLCYNKETGGPFCGAVKKDEL